MISLNNNPEKIKFFLYSMIILIITGVAAVFISYRYLTEDSDLLRGDEGKATVSLDHVSHTATKEGIKHWSLSADTVDYYKDNNKAVFKGIKVVLFSEDNTETRITADTGIMNTETSDIEATGNVVAEKSRYTLESETLLYDHSARIITSPVPVRIYENTSQITADTMKSDLNSNITILEGNVEGTFRGDFKLF